MSYNFLLTTSLKLMLRNLTKTEGEFLETLNDCHLGT